MSVVLASVQSAETGTQVFDDDRQLWLESLDGTLRVALSVGSVLTLAPGPLGLGGVAHDLVESQTPGVPGTTVEDVRIGARPIALPINGVATSQVELRAALARLKAVVRRGATPPPGHAGTHRIVGSVTGSVREIEAVYVSGLEDSDSEGLPELERIVLVVRAAQPYALDRTPRTVKFGSPTGTATAMVSADPAAAAVTGVVRGLSSSSVVGQDMPLIIASDAPVYPTIRLVGPMADLVVTTSTGMDLSVPLGVPSGSALTIVTDPRGKSIRLDGEPAAGRVARGSVLGAPLEPGMNTLSVVATGLSASSAVEVSWRGAWWGLWD